MGKWLSITHDIRNGTLVLQRQRQHRNMLGSTKPLKLASLKSKYLICRSHWRGWVGGSTVHQAGEVGKANKVGWGRSLCDFTKYVLRRVCQYFHQHPSIIFDQSNCQNMHLHNWNQNFTKLGKKNCYKVPTAHSRGGWGWKAIWPVPNQTWDFVW